jgi:glycosyltransferase involved in cell wall biosynthesis
MPQVLHVTAHLGGGVGRVLSGVAVSARKSGSRFSHSIVQLEPTQNPHWPGRCRENGVPVELLRDVDWEERAAAADIIQIEWWHHPLMMRWMYETLPRLSCRLVVWSHISGCCYPYISPAFARMPERFVFTSPYSLENPTWTGEERAELSACSSVVPSSGLERENFQVERIPHSGFCVGYLGSLDYSKLHPDFVRFCSAVDIPDAYFTIAGEPAGGRLAEDVNCTGDAGRFRFTGYLNRPGETLGTFDAFGYPLCPRHTGTAENALLEAMAAGIPPVVLDQCSEKYLVRDRETGFAVKSIREYADAMRCLYDHPLQRRQMGERAREFVRESFPVERTVAGLERVYERVMDLPRKEHALSPVFGDSPHEWLRHCLNCGGADDPEDVTAALRQARREGGALTGQNKASVFQYARYFPEDRQLRVWIHELGGEQ